MLNQTGRFIVLGETDMRGAALDEQDFAASGRTAGGNKAPVTGQMTPAQLLVKGAITHVQGDTAGAGGGLRIKGFRIGGKGGKGEVNATIYLVDSTTGQVLASTNVVGSQRRRHEHRLQRRRLGRSLRWTQERQRRLAVQDACAEAVDFLIAQLPNVPWSGSVVMTKDGKVYVNRGSREGVNLGETFRLVRSRSCAIPDTGEVFDEGMTEICTPQGRARSRKNSRSAAVTSGDAGRVAKGMTSSPMIRSIQEPTNNHRAHGARRRRGFAFRLAVRRAPLIRLKYRCIGMSAFQHFHRGAIHQRRRSLCGSASRVQLIGPEHSTARRSTSPFQEDIDYEVGTDLQPLVEVGGVRWDALRIPSN